MNAKVAGIVFYVGRFFQAFAMWILLMDIFMAGPMGPAPNPFYVGVALFIIGWLMVRQTGQKK